MNLNLKKINFRGVRSVAKKYGYYAVLAVCLSVLTLVVVLTSPSNDNLPVGGGAIVFAEPVANATILKGYSDSELLYNQTLNQWEAHKAIQFAAPEGTNVLAAYDGVVQKIYTNYLEGTVIVINHGEGLKTVYGSLDTEVDVEEGDEVKKGDPIGRASASANRSSLDGSQVNFEVWQDDARVDPSAYLTIEDK